MDGVTLLTKAQQAGLEIKAIGGRLVVRGPDSAEPLAKLLLARKPEIMRLLRGPSKARRSVHDHAGLPGDWVKWNSPLFGHRTGRVLMLLGDGSALVQSDVCPRTLTLVRLDLMIHLLPDSQRDKSGGMIAAKHVATSHVKRKSTTEGGEDP